MSNTDQTVPNEENSGARGGMLWLKDHLEMIVVAFIMALVIRCFFVEVFKIPTGSMEPTLMGNHKRTGTEGDRIMVNKFYYLFHSVDRYDVIVFRYPLNVMRNFIKRAVGIGPEYIRMKNGDIYRANKKDEVFRIARKPFSKQQSVWIPLPPGTSGQTGVDILDTWRMDGSGTSESPEHIVLNGDPSPEQLIFDRPVRDEPVTVADRHRHRGPHQMKDVKIRSVISRLGSGDRVQYELFDQTYQFSLLLSGSNPARLVITRSGDDPTETEKTFSIPADLQADQNTIEMFVYDGQVGVTVNGELVQMYSYRERYDQGSSDPDRPLGRPPRLRAEKGEVRIHQLSLFRDIYYHWGKGRNLNFDPSNEPIKIPKNKLLVIGDNVNASRDSRKWKMRVFHSEDGEKHYVDERTLRRANTNQRTYVVDRSGRRFTPSELQQGYRSTTKPKRFVRKELLVGKAIWVWWPYNRMKFIR